MDHHRSNPNAEASRDLFSPDAEFDPDAEECYAPGGEYFSPDAAAAGLGGGDVFGGDACFGGGAGGGSGDCFAEDESSMRGLDFDINDVASQAPEFDCEPVRRQLGSWI